MEFILILLFSLLFETQILKYPHLDLPQAFKSQASISIHLFFKHPLTQDGIICSWAVEEQLIWFFYFLSYFIQSQLVQFSSVQSLSRVRLFVTPWIAAHQAFLSNTNSRSSLKLTSIKLVMPSSHLILCRPLFFLPPIPPSTRVFSNVSTLRMRCTKYWSFSFSIIPSKEHPGLILEWTG